MEGPGLESLCFYGLKKLFLNDQIAAVSIFSTALVWLGRIGSWGDGTGFIA